jgi:hypothetical protein
MQTDEVALALLLRSPRLSLTTILDLLDISDAEFRQIACDNQRIQHLLEARKAGTLKPVSCRPRNCPACGEWFEPYASERYCTDTCKSIGMAERASRVRGVRQPSH